MKKLLIINAGILLMLFIATILPDYYINNPVYFSLIDSFARFEWLIFLGILMGGALLSSFLACIQFKKKPYTHRFLRANIFTDIMFLIFILFNAIPAIFDAKRDYEVLLLEYRVKAESDIKNGLIIYETTGFPMPLDSAMQVKENKIDSVMMTYGITSNNIGCVISGPLLKAQSAYEELTASYLDKRNGPGWKNRMNIQIDRIRKN